MSNLPWRSVICLVLGIAGTEALVAQTRETAGVPAAIPAAIASTSPPSSARPGDSFSTTITGARAVLGPGDLLEISVFETPELTQRVRVNSDRKIMLSLIGEISVDGMTSDTLQSTIRTKLITNHFVRDPQVSVFVAEYAGQTAYISGEVNRPGAYPLLRSHRLSDMIAVAGGLGTRAGNLITINHGAEASLPMQVDLNDTNVRRRDPEVVPGDSIMVGQNGIVYVLGDVTRPGGFLLDRRSTLSVVQAVALAEGMLPSASYRKAELIRATDGRNLEIPIDLKAMLKAEIAAPQMQPGDILYIPTSLTRGLGRASLQTILSTASGVAIYSSAIR